MVTGLSVVTRSVSLAISCLKATEERIASTLQASSLARHQAKPGDSKVIVNKFCFSFRKDDDGLKTFHRTFEKLRKVDFR